MEKIFKILLTYLKKIYLKHKHFKLGLTLALFIIIAIYSFLNLGNWLIVRDELPETLDYIYIFAGDGSFNREKYGLSLLKAYPDAVIVLDSLWYTRAIKRFPKAKKVFAILDTCDIKLIGPSNSTVDEIANVKDFFNKKKHKKSSVGMISSPYHTKRIIRISRKMGLKEVVKHYTLHHSLKETIKVFDPVIWWRDSSSRKIVVSEYLKSVHTLIKKKK